MTIPDLEPHCGSWVATNKAGRALEFFDREQAQLAADFGWTVETAAKYLARINRNAPKLKGTP